MKKLEIKNPIARFLAGLGIILTAIGAGVGILYEVKKLTLPLWVMIGTIKPSYDVGDTVAAATLTFMSILTGFLLVGLLLIRLSPKIGNRLFKP